MLTPRPGPLRGHYDHGWLDTRHTFSFADYYDPAQMGFRSLRVINEDRVAPGQGFGSHGHRDMEIISYVIDGALGHKDSTGTGSTIRPGDVQRMSAGTGVTHSEMNASRGEAVHFLQIWILPEKRGIAPSYEQKHFTDEEKSGKLRLVASPDGAEGSVTVHQDVRLFATVLAPGQKAGLELAQGRHGWVQVVRGKIAVNGQVFQAGDGVAVSNEPTVALEGDGEALIFDLA